MLFFKKKRLKVLVGCEKTGIIRDAFTALGHDAISCDLEETYKPGKHFKGDLFEIINQPFDLGIFHPPCTYLAWSSKRYWNDAGRFEKRIKAVQFINQILQSKIQHKAIENPLGCLDAVWRPHDQIIEPFYFGDSDRKRTCLWLENLPLLKHFKQGDLFDTVTHSEIPVPVYIQKNGKKRYYTDSINGANNKKRSDTFPGVALAMASQWSEYILNKKK